MYVITSTGGIPNEEKRNNLNEKKGYILLVRYMHKPLEQ